MRPAHDPMLRRSARVSTVLASLHCATLKGRPVTRVICTHMHPDHVGNADWLIDRFSAPERPARLWMSATDFQLARLASGSTVGMGGEAAAAFFASHGLSDEEALAQIRGRAS